MNVENAKKIKLPDAQKIFEELEKARKIRVKERQPAPEHNISSDELVVQTVENSKGTPVQNPIQQSEPIQQPNPRPSRFSNSLRRICCCFKGYRVIPEATITIEK